MSTARLVIVTACYGSRGDVAPLARLARAIQTATKATNDDDDDDDERPTSVVFMANPHFAELAAGLDFHPTGDAAEYEARLADSKGRRHYGNGSVVDWWMRQLGTHVRAMRALFDGNQYESVVVVGHPLDLGVKTIEDLAKAGRLGPRAPFVRCVTALLSPSLLRSPDVKQPPFSLFRKLREHSSWLPSCVTRCVDCVDNTVVDAAFLPRLDVHRRALRLQLCPNGVYRNYFLCERSLLFVPEWFAPPQPETWPSGLSQVGWPLEPPNPRESNPEPPTAPSIPDALTRWLQETAPKYARTIVFFCGTGNPRHAPDFFAAAVAIVARMNKSYRDRDLPAKFRVIVDETKRTRAVFLTSHPETLPVGVVDGAIEGVFHCAYADLDALLPECTAIVHGGGVGTVAAAVTHATPQLVCPSAFDQYDNGQRVARRGVGEVMWAEKICEASRSQRVLKRVRNLLWRLSDPWETNPYRKQYVKLKRIDRAERAGKNLRFAAAEVVAMFDTMDPKPPPRLEFLS